MSAVETHDRHRGIPAFTAWWIISLLAALGIAVALYLLLTREPETVVRDVPSSQSGAPSDEMLAEVAKLDAESGELSAELITVLKFVAAYECPPGTAPSDVARLEALKAKANAMLGRTGQGQVQPAAPQPAVAPQDPEFRPAPTGEALARPVSELSQLLENAVVFILPVNGGRVSATGTGFFISRDLIVTNRHVIESADPETVIVTSDALGDIVRARVIATSPPGRPGNPDFALLKTERPVAPSTLPLAGQVDKLMNVLVAGYPGMALGTDAGFLRLLRGDRSAAPDMHQNGGEIRSTQDLGATTSIIHTADVLGGYSGGPLIDLCGRAVGMNTFIQVDQKQTAKFNSALSAKNIGDFLNRNGISIPNDNRVCK
ncbi:trypsin-like serine peptidase [Minwuia sp.]|uniref:trypsin-like serine peptidase n=1 Tax=Minwuia sp. TaxID=2493630 RepID=UPI003A8FA130